MHRRETGLEQLQATSYATGQQCKGYHDDDESIFAYLWAEGSPQGYAAALGATGWEAPAHVPVRWKRSDVERLE